MTNLEALKANISDTHGLIISENAFIKALTDEGSVIDETYHPDDVKAVDMATIRIYEQILGSASFDEGSVSYSVSGKELIIDLINGILERYNLPRRYQKVQPKINGVARW